MILQPFTSNFRITFIENVLSRCFLIQKTCLTFSVQKLYGRKHLGTDLWLKIQVYSYQVGCFRFFFMETTSQVLQQKPRGEFQNYHKRFHKKLVSKISTQIDFSVSPNFTLNPSIPKMSKSILLMLDTRNVYITYVRGYISENFIARVQQISMTFQNL